MLARPLPVMVLAPPFPVTDWFAPPVIVAFSMFSAMPQSMLTRAVSTPPGVSFVSSSESITWSTT
ncbi:hypothetical protein D3C83_256480 [compost metagenome]